MSPLRYRDEGSSSGIIIGAVVGALAGFAAGMYLSHNAGTRKRAEIGDQADEEHHERLRGAHATADELDEDFEDAVEFEESTYADDDYEGEEYDITLEERVLEAFRNDPVLSTRAVDIGSLRTGVIELAGVVDTAQEAQHAVTIARGVPGVQTVVNRIVTGIHEPRYREGAQGSSRNRQGSTQDVERAVTDSRAFPADMPPSEGSASPPNVLRADEPPRDEPSAP